MAKFDLLLVGPFRRTRVGGVRSHVRRLRAMVEQEGLRVSYVDPKSSDLFRYPWDVLRSRVVHLHNSNGVLTLLMALWARLLGRRVLATIHGELDHFSRSSRLGFLAAGKLGALVVVLNRSTATSLTRHGIGSELQSAYLPLSAGELAEKAGATHSALERMESFRTDHARCFLTYTFGSGPEHRVLYGIDELIGMFSHTPDRGLVILVSSDPGPLLDAVSPFRNVLVLAGDLIVPLLLAKIDGLIRNTTSDGDSLVVREAIACGARVFATNAVDRPAGVTTYPLHDMDELERITRETGPVERSEIREVEQRPDILRLYDRLLGR